LASTTTTACTVVSCGYSGRIKSAIRATTAIAIYGSRAAAAAGAKRA
jgi:hypothetical protein